jgi:hypothetical protein
MISNAFDIGKRDKRQGWGRGRGVFMFRMEG